MFNADEYIAAMSPPSIVIDGETHVGKLLSFDEMMALAPTFEQLDTQWRDAIRVREPSEPNDGGGSRIPEATNH